MKKAAATRMATTAYLRPDRSVSDPIMPARPMRLSTTGSWKDRPKASISAMTSERYSDTLICGVMAAMPSPPSCSKDSAKREISGSITK